LVHLHEASKCNVSFSGLHSSAAEVSILKDYGAVSVGYWCLTLWDNMMDSLSRVECQKKIRLPSCL